MNEKLIIAIAIAVFSFLAGIKSGLWLGKNDLAECQQLRYEMEAKSNELAQKNTEQRLLSERITADVSQRWADALAWERAHPRVVRVRDETCGSGSGVSSIPASSAGLNAGTAHSGLSAYLTASQCEERLNQAVMDAAQLMWLQQWIKQQGGAYDGK